MKRPWVTAEVHYEHSRLPTGCGPADPKRLAAVVDRILREVRDQRHIPCPEATIRELYG